MTKRIGLYFPVFVLAILPTMSVAAQATPLACAGETLGCNPRPQLPQPPPPPPPKPSIEHGSSEIGLLLTLLSTLHYF